MVTRVYNRGMNVEVLAELIEHKVAPSPLVGVQGLVNTYSWEDDLELLGDPEQGREWLVSAGLLDDGATVSPEELATLVEFREALREVLTANHTGEASPKATAKLADLAARHPVSYEVSGQGEVALDLEPAPAVGSLIGQVIGIVHHAQALGEWQRLKICAADDCRWAFYDTSKNRSGTWCQMELCGNRTKNRRYRSKA